MARWHPQMDILLRCHRPDLLPRSGAGKGTEGFSCQINQKPLRLHGQVSGYEAAAAGTSSAAIVRQLGGYLLPKDIPEYRWRVGGALALLVAAKGLNVGVGAAPLLFQAADT